MDGLEQLKKKKDKFYQKKLKIFNHYSRVDRWGEYCLFQLPMSQKLDLCYNSIYLIADVHGY